MLPKATSLSARPARKTSNPIVERYTISDARERLIQLIEAALAGEEIVIESDDQHAVQLVPLATPPRKPRVPGSARGLIRIADDFDDPLPDLVV